MAPPGDFFCLRFAGFLGLHSADSTLRPSDAWPGYVGLQMYLAVEKPLI